MGGYTIKDIVFLMNILMIRRRLSCSLHTVKNKQCISIDSKSIPLLLRGIRPFINPMPRNASFFSSSRSYSKRSESFSSSLCNPVLSYANADVLKQAIIAENNGKIGVYR